eukprot:CAMPEP_0197890180 /NCGR_PEP_ID=MMETSP1439-20131203/25681_1 /TAXON_ID=66791 /ORGANISM="Gonyaulax spinifera, Strain CCMP409" /LENGTH=155 /DNA_ID=CAMNT_0043510191 /DNA_START=345 /DNA_END=813 /DNA_ORIENTATION=-
MHRKPLANAVPAEEVGARRELRTATHQVDKAYFADELLNHLLINDLLPDELVAEHFYLYRTDLFTRLRHALLRLKELCDALDARGWILGHHGHLLVGNILFLLMIAGQLAEHAFDLKLFSKSFSLCSSCSMRARAAPSLALDACLGPTWAVHVLI